MAITTDVITGFPGESEAEFAESLAFVEAMDFAGGHIFTYSARPGTVAARLADQVPHAVRKERNARMRLAVAKGELRYQQAFIGRTLPVLWESAAVLSPDGWELSGLTDNYLRVTACAPQELWNCITPVKLMAPGASGLRGEIVKTEGDPS